MATEVTFHCPVCGGGMKRVFSCFTLYYYLCEACEVIRRYKLITKEDENESSDSS